MTRPQKTTNGDIQNTATLRLSIGMLARSGIVAGVIKLSSAGLAFVMFAAIAMITDARQFGLYSAAYAGASLVSFFASVGQQATVLRFWPQYAERGALGGAHALMVRAICYCLSGLGVSTVFVILVGLVPFGHADTPEWFTLCLAASVLSFSLAGSEFLSGAFRAKNALIFGLLPRDVIWRALVVAVVLSMQFLGIRTGAVTITLLSALVLLAVSLPQVWILARDTFKAERVPLTRDQKKEFDRVTVGLWGVTSLTPSLGQASTLLVAAILGPELAGAIFVAERTTRLVVLALSGINQALAPQISAAFYSDDRAHVQRITSLTALGSLGVALVILTVFWLAGPFILSVFDHSYATPRMHLVLMIFALGATVVTACGPIELLLQLTGLQHALLKLLIVVNVVGLALTALMADLFGPIGAASAMAGTVITWTLIALGIAWRAIGINPSVFGLGIGFGEGRPAFEAKRET